MLTGLIECKLRMLIVNRCLYEQIKRGSHRDHGVCFMTPTAIMHHNRKARAKNIEDASRVIATRLSTRKQNDLVLLPYNPGLDFRQHLN
jgi:hypothetical protein